MLMICLSLEMVIAPIDSFFACAIALSTATGDGLAVPPPPPPRIVMTPPLRMGAKVCG